MPNMMATTNARLLAGPSLHCRARTPLSVNPSPNSRPIATPRGIGFDNAPTEILIGGGVFLTATIAFIASQAIGMAKNPAQSTSQQAPSSDEPEVLPRENAVIVFGAAGRSGRQIVSKLLASGRTVVAAVRDSGKALDILGEQGVVEGRNSSGGILFVEGSVDVTDSSSLTPELFSGVTSVVISTGAVFGRDEQGNMGYLNGMTPEKVDSQGVAAIAAAAAKYVAKQGKTSTVVMPFQSAGDLEAWQKLDDVIMGGNSDSALSLSEAGDGFTWSGKLVLEGGGFCGARSYEKGVIDLSAYDGISLRVRGSGETLKLNIKTADLNEPEDTYQATFDVPDGEWGDVFIPWHEFVAVKRARSVPDGPALNPATISQFGLVYSRFSFNGFANPNHTFGDFQIDFARGIKAFRNPKPQIVLISSAGVERNALVGNDEEKRKAEIPIVQLNPGGILNHKYDGEIAVRASGLPYTVIRPTGMISDDDQPEPCLLEMSQGDSFTGKITRSDVAQVVDATLSFFPAVGKTVEVRRSQADDAQGKSSTLMLLLPLSLLTRSLALTIVINSTLSPVSDAKVANLFLAIAGDDVRTRTGVLPFPAPVAPPAPVSEERKQEILSDERVQAAQPRVDAGKAGGRVRDAEETDEITAVEDVSVADADAGVVDDNDDGEVRKVQAWILNYKRRTLEAKLPVEETSNV